MTYVRYIVYVSSMDTLTRGSAVIDMEHPWMTYVRRLYMCHPWISLTRGSAVIDMEHPWMTYGCTLYLHNYESLQMYIIAHT